jgi:Protein of unknown function (DUF551)
MDEQKFVYRDPETGETSPVRFMTFLSEWIKCSDRLPEHDDFVLFWDNGFYIGWLKRTDRNSKFVWLDEEWTHHNPTHWMPLPSPPEASND